MELCMCTAALATPCESSCMLPSCRNNPTAPSTSFSSSAVAAQAGSVGAPGVLSTLDSKYNVFCHSKAFTQTATPPVHNRPGHQKRNANYLHLHVYGIVELAEATFWVFEV